ncbi:MAG TPA: hypothetical protein VGS18_04385, partial [Thermoplasmata archaeon]|nr:hypothetical protein [Thermoplasmata archaeon]
IAEDPELDKELTLGLQVAARHLRTHLSRRNRRAFAQEKFDIILRILPKLAEKTSGLVGKPVPDLTPVITKIMDVVNVETTFASTPDGARLAAEVTNYTPRARVLEIFVELPPESVRGARFEPEPEGSDAELGRVWWTLAKLPPSGRTRVSVLWSGPAELEASDPSWFVAGVDEGHLLGAEPLPGDWDVRLPKALIEAAASGTPDATLSEETEVDYDAAEASARADEEE